MTFVKIRPRITRRGATFDRDRLRVAFRQYDNQMYMLLYIGETLANKFGIKKGDRYSLLIDDTNNFIFILNKDPEGWTVGTVGDSRTLRLNVPWGNRKLPIAAPTVLKYADASLYEGELMVKLASDAVGKDYGENPYE
jgi:hypothetical protein